MPLRRIIPSFTVEVRSRRWRPKSENASSSWVDLARAPIAPSDHPGQVVELELKSIAAEGSTEPVMPASRLGRILPNISEPDPSKHGPNGVEDERPRNSRKINKPDASPPTSSGVVEQPHTFHAQFETTKMRVHSNQPNDQASAQPDQTPHRDARKSAPRPTPSKHEAPRPAPSKHEADPRRKPHAGVDTGPPPAPPYQIAATSLSRSPPSACEPPAESRKRAILSRYVFLHDDKPGEKWKRRLLARHSIRQ